jgi:hypothetical protein
MAGLMMIGWGISIHARGVLTMLKLTFDKGTIQIQGDIRVPNCTWDERSETFRAIALYYGDIIDFLKASAFEFRDDVLNLIPCPIGLRLRN